MHVFFFVATLFCLISAKQATPTAAAAAITSAATATTKSTHPTDKLLKYQARSSRDRPVQVS
jgi:hypothetical protein